MIVRDFYTAKEPTPFDGILKQLATIHYGEWDSVILLATLAKKGWVKVDEGTIQFAIPDSFHSTFDYICNVLTEYHYSVAKHGTDTTGFLGGNKETYPRWVEIANALLALAPEVKESRMGQFYDIVVKMMLTSSGSQSFRYTPPALVNFALSKSDLSNCHTIFDPFAKDFGFGAKLDSAIKYIASSDNPRSFALGCLNLMLSNKSIEDVHEGEYELTLFDGTCDAVIINSAYLSQNVDSAFAYEKALASASQQVIYIGSSRICFPKERDRYLRQAVYDGQISKVIQLPENLEGVAASGVMIISRKDGAHKRESVRFTNPAIGSVEIPIETIHRNDCIIYPDYYLVETPEFVDGNPTVKLYEFLKPLPRNYSNLTEGCFFSYRAISDLKGRDSISTEDIPLTKSDSPKSLLRRYWSQTGDFLIFSKLKFIPIYCKPGDDIQFTQDFWPFRLNTEKVMPEYLIAEMNKPYFKEQFKRYGNGRMSGAYMNIEDFLHFRICLPQDLGEQAKKVLAAKGDYVSRYVEQLEATYQRRYEEFVLGQRQRKHAVQQVLGAILPAVKNIRNFVNFNQMVTKDSLLDEDFDLRFGQYLDRLVSNVEDTVKMVDNFTIINKFQEAETIDLIAFLKDYKESNLNLDYPIVLDESIESSNISLLVSVAPQNLKEILDSLCTNARVHGFVDKNRADYAIHMSVSVDDNSDKPTVLITVSNNGIPVSDSIDLDRLFLWGLTGNDGKGQGIGCSHLQEIARHFGGDASYQENKEAEDGFASSFIISLPLIDQYENQSSLD